MQAALQSAVLAIYFDGACYLCWREIRFYMSHKNAARVKFVDIASPDFNALAEGLDPDAVFESIHARDLVTGHILTRVVAFEALWKVLDCMPLARWAVANRYLRPIIDLCYIVFAKFIRPNLPKRKFCSTGACAVRPSKGRIRNQ